MFSRQSHRIQVLSSVFTVLFICIPATFALDTPSQIQDLQQAAEQLVDQQKYSDAAEKYQQIVRDYPGTSYAMQAQSKTAVVKIKAKDNLGADAAVKQLLNDYSDKSDIANCVRIISSEYIKAKKLDNVKQLCQLGLSKWPGHKDAVLLQRNLAIAYVQSKEYAQAEVATSKMLSDYPGNKELPKGVRKIAESYYKAKQYDKAMSLYQTLVTTWPEHKEVIPTQKDLAIIYIQQGNDEQVDTIITNLMAHSELNEVGGYIREIAKSYDKARQYDTAVNLYQTLVTTWPKHKEVIPTQRDMAIIYIQQGNDEQADTIVTNLMAHSELEARNYALKIEHAYFKAGKYEKAKTLCQQALDNKLNRTDAILTKLAINHIRLGEFRAAEAVTAQLIADYSGHPPIGNYLTSIASYYFSPGKPEKAKELCELVLTNWPDHTDTARTQWILASSLIKLEEYEEAEKVVSTLLADYSDHPWIGDYIQKIASYYFEYNQLPKAKELYQTVTQNWPKTHDIASAHAGLAAAYLKLEETSLAETETANLLSNFSEHRDFDGAVSWLAEQYSTESDYSKAFELYQLVLSRKPASNEELIAHGGLARTYIRTGDDAKADEELNGILRDYAQEPDLGNALFEIGEEYHLRAEEAGDKDTRNLAYKKAIAVWQKNVNEVEGSYHRRLSCYYSATLYQRMGKYKEAISGYEHVIELSQPGDDYRCYALYMIAECYGILKNQQRVPISQANREIQKVYTKIIAEFPDSPKFQIAKEWADRHLEAK